MVDKIDILANFDIENNLSDCSSGENLSDLSLSDSSDFEECNNAPKYSDPEIGFFERETVEVSLEAATFDGVAEGEEDGVRGPQSEPPPPTVGGAVPPSDYDVDSKSVKSRESTEWKDNGVKEDADDDAQSVGSDVTKVSMLSNNYEKYLDSSALGSDRSVSREECKLSVSEVEREADQATTSQEEKRYQNLQDEINLLNILMFEAENQTEKCGSLYHSFTNEINNNLTYSKADVVDDCAGSLASLVDGSKFDSLSVKSELIFSDYGKSETDSDVGSVKRSKATEKRALDDEETESVCSTVQAASVTPVRCRTCRGRRDEKRSRPASRLSTLSNEDRVIALWNQLLGLKCSLKALRLNLKEQQVETLMRINEFLIDQNSEWNSGFRCDRGRSDSSTNVGKESGHNVRDNLSDTSLILSENNKVKEDIALNNLKIALIECNMLSSTASALVQSIPKYASSSYASLSDAAVTESRAGAGDSSPTLPPPPPPPCRTRNRSGQDVRRVCTCATVHSDKSNTRIEQDKLKPRRAFAYSDHHSNVERKIRSHEQITNKYPETKYSVSEERFQDLPPKVCS